MAEDTNFFLKFARSIKTSIHVAAPARVIAVHADGTADVVILYKKDGEESSPLQKVPVMKHVVQVEPLAKGDVVHLNFADQSLDEMNGSQSFEPASDMLHRLADAVIVGVYP